MGYQKKSYKKFVATAATATLVATALVPAAAAAGFSDVAENNEFKPFIDALSEQGIIKGYTSDNTFHPYQKITRGQVTIMLGRWLEKNGETVPADWATNPRFSDVSTSNEELAKYAALVKDAGVFEGVNGELLPYQNITREHIAAVLDRASQQVNGFTLVESAEKVADKEVVDMDAANADYRDEIQALVDLEISTVSNFRPKEDLTRAQFAKFLYKTMNVTEQEAAAPTVDELLAQLKDIENTLPAVEAITAENVDAMKEIADKAAADIDAIKTLIEEGDYSEEEVAALDKMIRDVAHKLDGVLLKIEEVKAETPATPTVDELLSQLKDIENKMSAIEDITADNAADVKALAEQAEAELAKVKEKVVSGEFTEEEKAKLHKALDDVANKINGVLEKVEEFDQPTPPTTPSVDDLLKELESILGDLPKADDIKPEDAEAAKEKAEQAAKELDAIEDALKNGDYSDAERAELETKIKNAKEAIAEVEAKAEQVIEEAAKPPVITKVTNEGNNKIVLVFDRELDHESASKQSNYHISDGVNVESAVLSTVDGVGVVTLTLNGVKETGNYDLTVNGVKSQAGVVMHLRTIQVSLTDNLQPEVVSAEYLGLGAIKITFSENVEVAGFADEDDFAVEVGSYTHSHYKVYDYHVNKKEVYIHLLPQINQDGPQTEIEFNELFKGMLDGNVKLITSVSEKSPLKDEEGNKIQAGTVELFSKIHH